MKKLMFLLVASVVFLSCQKEEMLAPAPVFENEVASPDLPPYQIPEIKSESDFSFIVYIDPTVNQSGDGSISSPLKTLPATLQPNTAYLIKRGTTHPGINRLFGSVLLGAYGQGAMPVISGGLTVQNHSKNSTIRDLDITSDPGQNGGNVVDFIHQNKSSDITLAYNKIRGSASNGKFPKFGIHHAVDGLVLFNNEVFNIDNNGWWLTPHNNIRVVRNWFHNVNKGGENTTDNSGDGIQAEYGMDGMYFAGNIIDKSNSMWKYALMLNGTQTNNTIEYNTFYAPKPGAGGAAIRWMAHQNGIFRKNLVRSICNQGNQLVVPFDTWDSHANKGAPYGIRDNHILRENGNLATVATNGVSLDNSNSVFTGLAQYQQFLAANPGIGLYGSDITKENFWQSQGSSKHTQTAKRVNSGRTREIVAFSGHEQ